MRERVRQYALLMRWHRPIGVLLLLWPTLWALWIAARGWPTTGVLIAFLLGVVLMRSAGCVINDYADRHIDAHVARTRARPLASGRVSAHEALALFAVLIVLALAVVLTLNRLTQFLAAVALLLAAVYPFMKRYTHFPQVFLGAAFGWAIPMAFAAQTGMVPGIAWWLFAANVLWSVAYDTEYAMVDREDDLRLGVKSTAILFGSWDRVFIALLLAAVLGLLALIGHWLALSWRYYVGLAVAAMLALYQIYLIKDRKLENCFKAFLSNNWLGLAVFAGIAWHYEVMAY